MLAVQSPRRNLLIPAAVLLAAAWAASAAADEAGFVPLFNGQSLAGWEGDPAVWRVEDGAIVGQTTAESPLRKNTFLIWRPGLVDDFELAFSYRLTGGNSGVQYRSRELPDQGEFVVGGYQADFEAGPRHSGILYEERGRGILAERGQRITVTREGGKVAGEPIGTAAELQARIRPEDWNEFRVVARGNRLQHFINGQLMSETVDEQVDQRRLQGILALQLHAGPPMKLEAKDIRLRRLKLAAGHRKLVLVAGRPSHASGEHEFRAGCLLLKKCLDASSLPLVTAVYADGWPTDATAFDNADAVFVFSDGGGRHPVLQGNRLAQIAALARRGVGVACLHYAVEVPKETAGAEFLDWLGGYFEMGWSVNPHWRLEQTQLAPDHPITRGVKPFTTQDEWYYHMRFREPPTDVTMLLSAVPPDATRERPDGPHSNNPTVRAGKGSREVLAWARERPDGGRGFGCTGGHFHRNWADDDFRRLMLNALVWTSGLDVPAEGVSSTVTAADLAANLDDKPTTKKPPAKKQPAQTN